MYEKVSHGTYVFHIAGKTLMRLDLVIQTNTEMCIVMKLKGNDTRF